jgi:thiamine kinase-like enzyme
MKHDIDKIVSQFIINGRFIEAKPFGSGHINDTFLISVEEQKSVIPKYVCQRINHEIFKNPIALMTNFEKVINHQRKMISTLPKHSKLRPLSLISNQKGNYVVKGEDGSFWRMMDYIEEGITYDIVETPKQAYKAARGFGLFQKLLSNLSSKELIETIPNFHNTPKRLKDLENAIEKDQINRATRAKKEIEFILNRKNIVNVLLDAHNQGLIPERITHNDTKLNNVMLNADNEIICIIDLDTVMPGLSLYDFGDMVRTATCFEAEDEKDLSKIKMNIEFFKALTDGFLDELDDILTPKEKELMPFSGKLITLEIGIRFLEDYLKGDVYFKTSEPDHNLIRCRTQLKLVESIEEQEDLMNKYITGRLKG